MNKNKSKTYLIFIPALLLTLIMFLPTIVQFVHVFEKHEQVDCNEVTTHIHEHKLECTTCDFNLNPTYYHAIFQFEIKKINIDKIQYFNFYNFKYYHQQLSFSLRGPPELLS